jgi:aspartyl protease family protein
MPVPQRDYRWQEDPEPQGQGGCFWTAMVLLAIGGLVIALLVMFPAEQGEDFEWPRLAYLVALLAVIGVSVGGMFRGNPGRTVRHLAIWLGIGAVIALLYSFRHEFGEVRDRLAGNMAPARGVESQTGRAVTLYAQADGHFYVEAEVEREKILFMVDTGASDVTLSRRDAQRLGIDPRDREFTQIYQTANGQVRGAPVTLDSVAIGPIDLRNVRASVNEAPMGVSLLGMSFLGRLDGYQVNRDRLTLRQ